MSGFLIISPLFNLLVQDENQIFGRQQCHGNSTFWNWGIMEEMKEGVQYCSVILESDTQEEYCSMEVKLAQTWYVGRGLVWQ
jgi:hypothetical protein